MNLEDAINEVVEAYLAVIPERKFRAEIKIQGNSYTANYCFGLMFRKREDLVNIELKPESMMVMSTLLTQIDGLRNEQNISPYKFNLKFDHSGKFKYQSTYPNLDFKDLSEVSKDASGYFYADYIYINLNENLIKQLDNSSLNKMVTVHVEEARSILNFDSDVEYTKNISHEFYLIMLGRNAQSEIENGQFYQLFSNFSAYPASILVDVFESFTLFDNPAVTTILTEAFQIYSHFHENLNEARQILKIDEIVLPEESDIMARYYNLSPSIDEIRADFIRNNADKFYKQLVEI
jgi:hypothetical protein